MKIKELFNEETKSGKQCGKCGDNTIVNTKKGWYCSNCDNKKTNETTSAGGVAAVAMPIGTIQKRMPTKKKKLAKKKA
jgi:ribosomal protein L37AE/L43A